MTDQIVLHRDVETHLWYGSFAELAAEQIDPTTDRVLLLSEIEQEITQMRNEIRSALGTAIEHLETYTGDQNDLPMDVDSFDVTILSSQPRRRVFERHQPLYQSSFVTRKGGTIVYRAEQGLPHSDAVQLDRIHPVDWEDGGDPLLAALMTVTAEGVYDPNGKHQKLDVGVPIQTDDTQAEPVVDRGETQTTEGTTLEAFA